MPAQPRPRSDAPDVFRVADLARTGGATFDHRPDRGALRRLTDDLDVLDIQDVRLAGTIVPAGNGEWDLAARLTALVVQACVITLEPVKSRIDETVNRRFRRDLPDEEATGEVEMPEDETLEPLGQSIDVSVVLAEAVALALPVYPRSDSAALGEAVFTEPGKKAMTDAEAKPLAGLADLKQRLQKKPD